MEQDVPVLALEIARITRDVRGAVSNAQDIVVVIVVVIFVLALVIGVLISRGVHTPA